MLKTKSPKVKSKDVAKDKSKKKVQGTLLYGVNPLLELIRAKRRKLIAIYTTKPVPKSWKKIEQIMPKYPVMIQYVTREVLNRMAGTTEHQGIVSWAQDFVYRKKPFDPKKEQAILMLDGVQDPRNLGAILRSAYCTNMDGVIISSRNAAPLNAAALKASAGLAEHLEIQVVPSVETAAGELKSLGYTLYLAAFNGKNATTYAYKRPLCLVIGSEGFGITPSVAAMGTAVTLPQRTGIDVSYNASVAAALLMFQVNGQFIK